MPGLSELIGGAEIEAVVQHSVVPNLDVLTRGSLAPNPADSLMSDRFKLALEHFSKRYSLVIIDTPPVLAVTDAALIGQHVGMTLLVIRHGWHRESEVSETVKRLRNAGISVSGALFSDVPQNRIGYDAYDAGHYEYRSKTTD